MLRRSQRKADAKTVVVQMLLKNSVRRIEKMKRKLIWLLCIIIKSLNDKTSNTIIILYF